MEIFQLISAINGFFSIFVLSNKSNMKSKEFHKLIQTKGWIKIRQAGSHVIYEKDGRKVSVPTTGQTRFRKELKIN